MPGLILQVHQDDENIMEMHGNGASKQLSPIDTSNNSR